MVFKLAPAPLLLGSVCRRWRTIALSTPWLWASFALTIREDCLKSHVLLANTWLSRAGTCPLSIALGDGFYFCIQPLMQVFLLHWYDIHLSLSSHALCSLSSAKNRLPMLQKLCVHNSTMDETVDVFECAPQLCCFSLSYHSRSSMIKVPWNQLQHFNLGDKDIDRCLELLRLTPHLKSCKVWLIGLVRQSTPQLQHLHLCFIRASDELVDLFDLLLLPKLHEISIDILGLKWGETPRLVLSVPIFARKIFLQV